MAAKKTPQRRMCAAMQNFYRQCDEHPSFRARHARLEEATHRRLSMRMAPRRTIRVIPVVVHVVYRTPAENISMSQIRSQIRVLNADFRARNSDRSKVPGVWKSLIGDTKVQFKLADRDPRGRKDNGVTRTKTQEVSFSQDDGVKRANRGGHRAWPTDKYLNIWVCSLRGGLLGYAQFPGGPKSTDGVVILNTAFGTNGSAAAPFDKGRTTTHEVGHFFNLRHIWGDTTDCSGSDFVADTPLQRLPNEGKPEFPSISCGNGPHGDMFMNYMDYVDDAAMFLFTQGQVARMEATLEGPRRKLGKNVLAKSKARPRKRKSRRRKKAG